MRVIRLAVFANLEVRVFKTNEQRLTYLKQRGVEIEDYELKEYCGGMASIDTIPSGLTLFSMVIPEGSEDRVLVHECVHMADFIMDDLGMLGCTEVRAYLTDYIFSELKK